MERTNLALSESVLELLADLGKTNSDEKNIKIAIATALFTSKAVSVARAAEIAEVSLEKYMEVLNSKNIAWCELTEAELEWMRNSLGNRNIGSRRSRRTKKGRKRDGWNYDKRVSK